LLIPPVIVPQGVETGGDVFLLGDMIKSKTITKLLRRLGVALIVAPEPFTTPFGVALILVARYLSQRREANQNNRLQEMVRYYLAHNGGISGDADGQSSAYGSVERHTQSEEHPILQQYTGSLSFEANLAPSVWQNWQDMRHRTAHYTTDMQSFSGHYKAGDSFKVESGWSDTSSRAEKMIHHTINMERLSQRYEGEGSAVTHSNRARTSGAGKRVTPHFLNMKLLSQRPQTAGVGQTRVTHTINMAPLRQRYGSAVSSMRVHNALRNNNHYYDIVSKGNVIGGY
jgi:hypothetical protein